MPESAEKIKILFLCTGNSCRSMMAEGWTRQLKEDRIEPFSAGVEPKGIDPLAVEVMSEAGVDISGQRSKHVDEVKHIGFDYVITVCDHASENCPVFPGTTRVVHAGFEDPPALARQIDDEKQRMEPYRRVRDEIRAFVDGLPDGLLEPS